MPKNPKSTEPIKWGYVFGRPDLERIGLFAEMPYMNGKGYVSPFARDKSEHLKSFLCPGNKILVGLQDALFEKEFKRIFEKEAIVRRKKSVDTKNISQRPFISSVGSKLHSTPGDYYGCFTTNIEHFSPKTKPRQKRAEEKKPFVTSPGKKGGPGYIDITLSKYPTYEWTRYGQKPNFKQYGRILDGPMLTMIYPQAFFDVNPFADPPNVKRGRIYIRPQEKTYGKLLGPGFILPPGPGKWPGGMHAGCFDKFPVHMPDRYMSNKDKLKKERETKIFYPQSMANKSFYNTSILNQNLDFRVNHDNQATYQPNYLKYIAIDSISSKNA